jgi:hypothetical protein
MNNPRACVKGLEGVGQQKRCLPFSLEEGVIRTSKDVQRIIWIHDPTVQIRDGSIQSKDSEECRSCVTISFRGLSHYTEKQFAQK